MIRWMVASFLLFAAFFSRLTTNFIIPRTRGETASQIPIERIGVVSDLVILKQLLLLIDNFELTYRKIAFTTLSLSSLDINVAVSNNPNASSKIFFLVSELVWEERRVKLVART